MKTTHFTPALLIAALLGACSSMPKSTSLLDQTRSAYQVAQNNPKVANYASLEMKQASEALEQANAAARRDDSTEQIDKLAYLAKQKIALTEEVAKRKSAEAEVASAGQERDQMRLDMRTKEADRAHANAQMATERAAEAQRQTALAQRKTQEAEARTANLEAQLAEFAAQKTERGLVITLGDVLFGVDQTELTTDGMRTVQKLATILGQHPQRAVLIEGFTDSTGSKAYNQNLSERRATSVRSSLQDMGVARDRISMRGYGEAYPVAANDTKQDRQLNRRVEIIVSNGEGQIPQR